MNFKRIGIVAIIVCLLFCGTVCNATCREDMNGIWSFGNDIRPPHYSTDEYYIFKDDKFLCVNTISGDSCGYCRYKRRVGCHLFGFSSELQTYGFERGEVISLFIKGKEVYLEL